MTEDGLRDEPLANHVASGRASDDDVTWITPTGVDRSRERLVSIPEAYHDTADEAALRIADVGCGIGVLLDDLADAYPQADLLGVELATEAAAEATERFDGRDHVTVLEGDATELLPEQAPFDVVYAINVIQDTPDPFETLGVLSDALADDGLLVLTVPGQSGTELFPDAISRDPALDLPYLEMQDVTVGGRTFDWMQYVRPEVASPGCVRGSRTDGARPRRTDRGRDRSVAPDAVARRRRRHGMGAGPPGATARGPDGRSERRTVPPDAFGQGLSPANRALPDERCPTAT
ncbi:hypothetical protein BRC81_09790 [Halobacteriales archaeon QS_1_68_20]|nr:MAG: hypothetical protein BRC81_09790 [Halobacteriales archaeon QS_1_68_20]